jgi:hypothetical protein
MPTVARRPSGIRVAFEENETDLLRGLIGEMRTLLTADVPPSDRVLQRLFPKAYESDEDERAYRELTGDDLAASKLEALAAVSGAIGDAGPAAVDISEEDLGTWLSFLTDARLAIGTRLDVTEEKMETDIDPDDPDGAAWSVLHWLGYIQEMMLQESLN